jgi:hypothetical protein
MSVDNHSVKQEATFYHPKPERFAEICQRFFRYIDYNYSLAQREVPIPALLRYTGLPVARNQFCFSHKGQGTALSVYRHRKGFWMFHCCGCGIQGDVVKMWYLMVKLSGFAPIAWDMPQACGDLLARAEAGIIDLSVEELETSSHSRGARRARGTRAEDPYWNKLKELDKHQADSRLQRIAFAH